MKYRIVFLLLGVFFSTCDAMARDTLRFGRVRQGHTVLDTLRIPNIDVTALMISNPRVSNPAFLPAAPLPSTPLTGTPATPLTGVTIEPNGEGFLPISFIPNALDTFIAKLIMDTNRGIRNWVLSGEGVEEVVVINEILADPPSGDDAGDANRDGSQNRNEDEFVEILNTGLRPINIGGWQLSDNSRTSNRFAFPDTTWIAPGEYIVLFGGGTPTGFTGQVFVDDGKIGRLGLSNTSDQVFLINPVSNDTLASAGWGREGGNDQSLVRYPEGIGEWVLHTELPGTGEKFSPGRARALRVQRRGDLNGDEKIDLIDAVRLVHIILGVPPASTALERWAADVNESGDLDIRDLIALIARFTGLSSSSSKVAVAPLKGWWWEADGQVWMQTNRPVHVVVGKLAGENAHFDARSEWIAAVAERDFVLGSANRNGFGDAPNPLGNIRGEIAYLEVYTLSGVSARLSPKPKTSGIRSSFPNPFNPDTVIEYEIAHRTRITLSIFTPTGQEIVRLVDQVAFPGQYRKVWNGRDAKGRPVASGVYIARLSGANFHATRKLVLLK